jgi:hypothetical protein
VGFLNLDRKREMEAAVGRFNRANADLTETERAEAAKDPDVSPEDATPEQLAAIHKSNKLIVTKANKAYEAAKEARDLGVAYHRSSGGLATRRNRARQWEKAWGKRLTDLRALLISMDVVETFYEKGGTPPSTATREHVPAQPTSPATKDSGGVAYEVGDWNPDKVNALVAAIKQEGIPFAWDNTALHFARKYEARVDALIDLLG